MIEKSKNISKKIQNIIIINDFNYIQGGASKVAIDTANLLANNTDYNIYFFSGNSNDKRVTTFENKYPNFAK
jgi:hypothetical protein